MFHDGSTGSTWSVGGFSENFKSINREGGARARVLLDPIIYTGSKWRFPLERDQAGSFGAIRVTMISGQCQ